MEAEQDVKPVPAVFFDADGTWYRWQLITAWVEGMVEEGLLPRIVLTLGQEKHRAYQNREGTFTTFIDQHIGAYHGDARLAGIRVMDARFVAERVIREQGKKVHVFARELALAAREVRMRRAIISGSMVEIVRAFAKANEVSIFVGTDPPHLNGRYTGGPAKEWCLEKGNVCRNMSAQHNLDLASSVAIGDTVTDIQMFELVGYPICFNPTKALLVQARERRWPVVIEKKNMHLILKSGPDGSLHEVELTDILPPFLAARVGSRLRAVTW